MKITVKNKIVLSIISSLIIIILLSINANALNVNFTYVPTTFNMVSGCNGQIKLGPNSTLPATVCLQYYSGGWSDVSNTCKNYTSGTYGIGSSLVTNSFDSSLLTPGGTYRVKLTWGRIQYVSMNNSGINGYYDSGQLGTSQSYSECGVVSDWPGYMIIARKCGQIVYNYPACTLNHFNDWDSTCGNGIEDVYTAESYFYLGSTNCSGTPYRQYVPAQTTCRTPDSYIIPLGTNASISQQLTSSMGDGCYDMSGSSSNTGSGCDVWSHAITVSAWVPACGKSISADTTISMAINDMTKWYKNCTVGNSGCPSSLCTYYAGEDYSSSFTYNASATYGAAYATELSSSGSIAFSNPTSMSSVILNSTQSPIYINSTIDCYAKASGVLNVSYEGIWYKNGAQNSTFTSSVLPPNTAQLVDSKTNLTSGDTWICSIRTYDGYSRTNYMNSSSVPIIAYPLSIDLPILNSTYSTAFLNDTLFCWAKANGLFNITYEGFWRKNGIEESNFNTTEQSPNILTLVSTLSGFSSYDNWTCRVRASDNAEGTRYTIYRISNQMKTHSYPFINYVNITPLTPSNNDTIICRANSTNEDGDNVTYEFTWYQNQTFFSSTNITGITNTIISNQLNTSQNKHQNWSCGARIIDGPYTTEMQNSSEITIKNFIPILSANIIPSPALANDTLNCSISSIDIDNDSLSYSINWTIDDILSDVHTNILSPGNFTEGTKMICSAQVYDGEEYSEWTNSNELIINDITAPTISNWSVPPSPYNDEVTDILVDCWDLNGVTEAKVSFINTNSLAVYNLTMTNIGNNTYRRQFVFSTPSVVYNDFIFYCKDGSNNVAVNITTLSVMSRQRAEGGGGAGGGAETREVFITTNQSNFCGDNICGEGEDPTSCNKDCKVNFDTLITCLFNKQSSTSCNWDQAWFPTALLAFVIIIGIASILISRRRKK